MEILGQILEEMQVQEIAGDEVKAGGWPSHNH